ncbi:MAG: acetate kinase [Gammaproteobacteria bacterium]|nr:acetate kinase [Gammaproteobacteria bacterium]MDJ0872211.1 acetate kinase [Gammaproteobacteria bacterium]MDJ0893009.1 acetate kinase [Gammaproteobacteria bacterium]
MKILVLNSGSSSIKYQLYAMADESVLASGMVERIGDPQAVHTHQVRNANGDMEATTQTLLIENHEQGLARIALVMRESGALKDMSELFGIGHRVVHGGDFFQAPTLVDAEVIDRIREMSPLAPLHNPANSMGIEVALKVSPGVPQVAVFDTAFHQSMPRHAYRYAIPESLYSEHRARRYGFHGTSHAYVAEQAAAYLGKPLEELKLITLHLGNGASAAAIEGGRSIDTSMGMTPLEGLVMGTRCGDLDPAIHFYLARETDKSFDEIEDILNRDSGLKGVCGKNDMREIHDLARAGSDQARLALDMYCYRLKKYIGAYYAVLGRVDAIVFTAGVGENDPWIRQRTCEGLTGLGIRCSEKKNNRRLSEAFDFHDEGSAVTLLVVPTNEELEIAHQTVACIRQQRQ